MKRLTIVVLLAVAGGIVLGVRGLPAGHSLLQEPAPVVINEVLVDPAPGGDGDANGDGTRDTYEDEFIELVNRSAIPVDISGWELGAAGADPFVFPPDTRLAPGAYMAVFGGGTPTGLPGPTLTAGGRLGSGLTNTAGRLLLIDPAGPDTLQDISYQGWDADGAFSRDPEGWGSFVEHLILSPERFSPAGPAVPGGGPDQSQPTVYRLRIVNLTSAGYQVAWRTPSQADGRLEVGVEGIIQHRFDPLPAGLLHLAGIYGLAPETPTRWRVVSSGTIAPQDSMESMTTGYVVTSVPYTVYGTVTDGVAADPVVGAHVFLRASRGGGSSGWLAAVTDTIGRWNLNLGNLRTVSGDAYPWSIGDTLRVEVDGGATGVGTVEVLISGVSPQEVSLPAVELDPSPVFTWAGLPQGASADATVILSYSLADQGDAWARVHLRRDGETERVPADTDPSPLPRAVSGSAILTVRGFPEGSLWWIAAKVEDGLNPPQWVEMPQPLRISHAAGRAFPLPAGVILFTPTLDDPALQSAHDWLGRLPGSGELARWDIPTASWISTSRLGDGTVVGDDFQATAGEGYALVSVVAGSLQISGPRRYSPPVLQPAVGLALVGVCDSTLVRTAGEVLADHSIRAVSRWDFHHQAWQGRFRLPGGELVGDDFLINWGEAVALDLNSTITWQPTGSLQPKTAGPEAVLLRPARVRTEDTGRTTASLLACGTGPGAVDLFWRAPPGAFLQLEHDGGMPAWLWSGADEDGWRQARVTGLAPGSYRAVLRLYEPGGEKEWVQEVWVECAAPPAMPVWGWGPAPSDPGPLLLEIGDMWVRAKVGSDGGWYAALPSTQHHPSVADRGEGLLVGPAATAGDGATAVVLLELAPDGGWTRWTLAGDTYGSGLLTFSPAGPPLGVSGLEVEEEGPLALKLRWQILHAEESLSFQPHLGYDSVRGGGGPDGDPRQWVPTGEGEVWEPGRPPALAQRITAGPGPEGQQSPVAVAIRITTSEGRIFWIGPGALYLSQDDEELALLPAAPNPFNPETNLRYRLPAGGTYAVRMEVRDVRGRRVRILVEAVQTGGSYVVRWDGRDGAGHPAAAGVYLVLLEVEGRLLSRKILLLR